MIKAFRDIFSLLELKDKTSLFRLQLLVFLMTILELLTIISIAPFVNLIIDSSAVDNIFIIKEIYLFFNFSNRYDFIFALGVCILMLLLIASCISIFTIWRISNFSSNFGISLGNRLFKYYLSRDWIFHTRSNSSELIKKTSAEVNRLTLNVINPIFQLFSKIIFISAVVIVILVYEPIIGITGIGFLAIVYFLMFKYVRAHLDKNGQTITTENSNRFAFMSESFGSIKEIKILNKQNFFTRKFSDSGFRLAKSIAMNHSLAFVPRYLMEFLTFGGVIFVILVTIFFDSIQSETVLPMMAFFGLAGIKILPAAQQIYQNLALIRGNLASFYTLKEDLFESQKITNIEVKDSKKKFPVKRDITLKCISFEYENSKVLKDLSITINAKSIVGIVGTSGAGKTTLLNILLGLIRPTKGSLLVDGKEIKSKEDISSWQKSIGFVSQDIFLLNGSILENIAFGEDEKEVDHNKIEMVIKASNLENFIQSLDEGIYTEVGERGVQISGGQKQRIAIARALYTDSDVLIFDEATSALDNNTEQQIIKSIKSQSFKQTIIMVAHRVSSIKQSDIVIFLKNGQIKNKGSYDDLFKSDPEFRNLTNPS